MPPKNRAIRDVIKKASNRNLKQTDTKVINFLGKRYAVPIIREFEPRRVSLCVPDDCNAGSDCCHKVTVDGYELCRDSSERWVMRDKRGSWIAEFDGDSAETHFWEDFTHMLIALELEIKSEVVPQGGQNG